MKKIDDKKKFYWLGEQKKMISRRLWEEVFVEDSESFLDYYYHYKMQENDVACVWQDREALSMIHMNPYIISYRGRRMESYLLVAVATKESFRHQGLMRYLLGEVMAKSNAEMVPFIYLEPADEKIYLPFDFCRVSDQWQWLLGPDEQKSVLKHYLLFEDRARYRRDKYDDRSDGLILDDVEVVVASNREDDRAVAAFAREYLSARFDGYVSRTGAYYSLLRQELKSEGGALIYIKHEGRVVACYSYWGRDEREVREPMAAEGYEHILLWQIMDQLFMDDMPMVIRAADCFRQIGEEVLKEQKWRTRCQTMVRITNLVSLLEKMRRPEAEDMILRIKDRQLQQNDGMWHWKCDAQKSVVTRYEGIREPDITMEIADFTEYIFRDNRLFFNEIV